MYEAVPGIVCGGACDRDARDRGGGGRIFPSFYKAARAMLWLPICPACFVQGERRMKRHGTLCSGRHRVASHRGWLAGAARVRCLAAVLWRPFADWLVGLAVTSRLTSLTR